ncbi:histone-lysine N-methyltransferase ASH1L-like isoform X2 [Electrophorus electricus]|uniref:histone-lysine N-methyltransferase ASH1L-like isoform X2 n=1 Tax=Electrophorus electricus TaxID=8005 RepID=UPI0015D04443|nr:histone-lysine N-methyltransferase ASH1L-like isoform X2 [Electrophorus electricus]
MEKKTKKDLPTLTPERGEEYKRIVGKKGMRRTKAEELDASCKETDGRDQQLQHSVVHEADHSESNLKVKIGLGAKRTKKPPKRLENFICRPTVRGSQRPGSLTGHDLFEVGDGINAKTRASNQLYHSVHKKYNVESIATKTSSAITSPNLSTGPHLSLLPSRCVCPAFDSMNTMTAKKVLPKQTRRTDLQSNLTTEEFPNAVQPQSSNKLSISQKITAIKQTHSPRPSLSSSSPLQQNSSPQEGIKPLNKDMKEQALICPNSSHGNQSKTNLCGLSYNTNSLSSKQTSCLLKNVSSNSEISLSVNLERKEGEVCMEELQHPNQSDFGTITNEENGDRNVSMQQSSPCANDPPVHLPSMQVDSSKSPCKSSANAPGLSEHSKESKEQHEKKHLSGAEITMSSSQAVTTEQQNDGSTERSHVNKTGKKVMHCSYQKESKAHCSYDTNNSEGSAVNTRKAPASVNLVMDCCPSQFKQGENPSKKQKARHLRCSKTTKITSENNFNPVACTTVLQGCSKNETPSFKSSNALSSSRCERKPAGRAPKLKQSQSLILTTEISSLNKTQPRKRGRPKILKSEVTLQGHYSQLAIGNPSNNEAPQEPDSEPDVKKPRKRGRPKLCFSNKALGAQPALISKKPGAGDHQMTSKDKPRDTQKCNRSNRLIMKTIIRKINKMRVKRRDQVLTHILLGKKECDSAESPQEGSVVDVHSTVSPATDSLSSLVTSFGGKLGPQINVSKRGTIYMGKRRGRKPKCQRISTIASNQISFLDPKQMSLDSFQFSSKTASMHQSLEAQTRSLSGSSCIFKNIPSSSSPGRSSQINFNTKKVKPSPFIHLCEQQTSKAHYESTLTSNAGVGISHKSTLDQGEKEMNSRLSADMGISSTLTAGAVFTLTGIPRNTSVKGRPKALSSLPSQHLSSAHLSVHSGLAQDSNGTHITSPSLEFTDQEVHKFKCHRKSHHCLGHDKLRRHKYKCKKKFMQLKDKRQDPDFLAEVEDLVVRLSEIHIVQHITQTRFEDDGCTAGRKSVKGKGQTHDLPSIQEKVHPPAMFQINFSGYYSPHSALSCDPLHYVRMANSRRKHGCSSEPSEQIITHFPVMHKLGYPLPGGGLFHPSYKVPFTTTSLGFGLYRGYPSTTPLYPSPFAPSYLHHYSKNPIISPSKFHKKRTKYLRQDPILWGGKAPGTYPRIAPHLSCDCFTKQRWQTEKQREKDRGGRDEHARMRERKHSIEWLFWQNKHTKDNENPGDCSSNAPSSSPSSSIFSKIQNKDRMFPLTRINPSNQRQVGEIRWSEHQPPWPQTRGLEPNLDDRSLNQESKGHDDILSKDCDDILEGSECDGDLTSPKHPSRTAHSFLRQPKLFSNTQSQRRIRKDVGVTGISDLLMQQDGMQEFSSLADKRAEDSAQAGSLHFLGKHQHGDSPSSREQEKRETKGHKSSRRPLLQDEDDHFGQSSPRLMHDRAHPCFKESRNAASVGDKPQRHFKSPSHKNPHALEVTAVRQVKRRGPGRPKKNPPPLSPPCSPPSPRLTRWPTEEIERAGEGGRDKRQGDTVVEVIEAVIHEEQKRERQRRNTERERDGDLELKEGKDRTETSPAFHTLSASTGPLPGLPTSMEADEEFQPEKSSNSPPNKKYLWAGLYSDVYKTEDIPQLPQEPSMDCLEYNPAEHEYSLLPAPLHVGKYLRLKRIDFQLPYDIHWLCAHNKLFEKPDTLPQATTSDSSCKPLKSSAARYYDEDASHIRLSKPPWNDGADSGLLLCNEEEKGPQLPKQQEGSCDNEIFPSPLSSEERTFVMKRGIFLVRNYEKMRLRRALLLREGVGEREREKGDDEGSSHSEDGLVDEDPTIKSDRCLIEQRSYPEEEEPMRSQSKSLTHILKKIWDSIATCKGSSGQTLTAPLLNLCSRKRSDSALLDLSTVQTQLISGHYKNLEAFHKDMLRVFHCAEKYYGSKSSVGHDVSQLRAAYCKAHREASAHTTSFL